MAQREFDIILSYILMVCNPIAMILLFWLMIFYRLKVQRVEQKSSKRVLRNLYTRGGNTRKKRVTGEVINCLDGVCINT